MNLFIQRAVPAIQAGRQRETSEGRQRETDEPSTKRAVPGIRIITNYAIIVFTLVVVEV